MPVIKEKTFTLETTYLVQKALMATVYMENVNSFTPLRRLPAGVNQDILDSTVKRQTLVFFMLSQVDKSLRMSLLQQ